MTKLHQRRNPHDEVATLYERARPLYPDALFDDIIAYAKLSPGAKILEVGCGSGQATLPMARRGFAIDCIELGADMAALAREKLLAFPSVNVVCDNFETVSRPSAHYDLLLSATAFHWINPAIRFKRAHHFLKPGGSLALFWHRPVQTEISRQFLDPLQLIYKRICPELTENHRTPPAPDDLRTEYSETIIGSGYFRDLKKLRHYQATDYSAETYINLLGTFSDQSPDGSEQARAIVPGHPGADQY